jgi:hypothetical protein
MKIMVDLTPDKILLAFLNRYGIGTYVDINPLLIEIFPECSLAEPFFRQQIVGRKIMGFLQSLVKEGLIEIPNEDYRQLLAGNKQEYRTLKNHPIIATLSAKGVSLLNQVQPATQIIVTGNHNNLVHQSPSSYIKSETSSSQYPAAREQNKVSPEKKKVRSLIEMIAWLTGIAVSIIVISQTFFHSDKEVKKPMARADSSKSIGKDSLNEKHASPVRDHSARTIPYRYQARYKPAPLKSKTDLTNNKSQMVTQVKNPITENPPKEQKIINQEDVNNVPFKAVQRHIDLFDIRHLQSQISSKQLLITIFCGDNKECKIYAAEIRKSLDSMGYAVEPRIAFGGSFNKAVKRFDVLNNSGWIWIKVYPQYQY